MDSITEGKAKLNVHLGKISKKLPVFYNPVMKLNRDIAISLINASGKSPRVADFLAGCGVRGIRMLLECPSIESVTFNDYNPKAVEMINSNLSLNGLKAEVHCEDAEKFLLESKGFDYIDIDPFGSPNQFLDASVKRISRDGILAVTATDTSSLAGSSRNACIRKYWAVPSHDSLMHEVGMRILIRKVQLIGAQYDKALIPIFCNSTLHYMRVYFRCIKGKTKVDAMLKLHGMLSNSGPMWLGRLWDAELVAKMDLGSLSIITDEAKIDVVGFYDVHQLAKKHKFKLHKMVEILELVHKKGYSASLTHFSNYGIKTDMPIEEFCEAMKNFS